MESSIAVVLFFIFFGHVALNAWQHGTAYFISTQVFCLLTGLSWVLMFSGTGSFGILLVFFLFSLLINIKYITGTTFLDTTYMNLGRFKEACMEKGHMDGLEAFTVYGFYGLIFAMWAMAIVEVMRKWL